MAKGPSKGNAVIERLLEERRQYEAWIARLSSAEDATPDHVRARVKADYEARLQAVTEELRTHAQSARQTIEQKKQQRAELKKKEALAAEKLTETELRHAVGEYDEGQWRQVHQDAQSELVAVREELQAVEADLAKLEELDNLARGGSRTRVAPPPKAAPAAPPATPSAPRKPEHVDELAFIKSVTEDEKGNAPSPRRASGAQFQPVIPATSTRTPPPAPPRQSGAVTPPATPAAPADDAADQPRTLRCKDCGTMNLPTEWYCEKCGAELASV